MADLTEYHLINALSETTPQSLTELVEIAGISGAEARELLEDLARDGFVAAYRAGERTEYRLTPGGVGRRTMMRALLSDEPISFDRALNSITAAVHQAGIAANRERMADEPLSDHVRAFCWGALTEQHRLGRFDANELARRHDLLQAAMFHGQLVPIFDGLPMPPLYGELRSPPRKIRLSWIGPVVKIVFALPFLLGGSTALLTASNGMEYLGGTVFTAFALYLIYKAWRALAGQRY